MTDEIPGVEDISVSQYSHVAHMTAFRDGATRWYNERREKSLAELASEFSHLRFDRGQWSDRTKDALAQLWGNGHSSVVIGQFLGFSKNAVVGKAHRLDLVARPSPIEFDNGIVKQPRAPRVANRPTIPRLASETGEAPKVPLKVLVAQKVVAPPVAIPEPLPVAAPVLLLGKCRFPHWAHAAAPTHVYCDEPISSAESWCAGHRRQVFVRHAGAGV